MTIYTVRYKMSRVKFELPKEKIFASTEEAEKVLLERFDAGALYEGNHFAFFIPGSPPKTPYIPEIYGIRQGRKLVPLHVYWAGGWRPTEKSGWKRPAKKARKNGK